ncbi:SOS response-associated peptidase family protein [Mesorhizobium sp. Ld1326N3]|uniref:SOS response-associated peptidase family protein n=1 Tax=Mesorhizobium salmacidum TaxID=3015171 RepID=A0ABU8L8D0_9HYPH
MFKKAYTSRRCLVPVDGYFRMAEARCLGEEETALCHRHEIREPFALAGIWEEYADKVTGELIRTFAIATCEPNELMASIHDACR